MADILKFIDVIDLVHVLSIDARLLYEFCAVHHLFGHERNLAVSRCLRIGPRTPQHGTKARVCFASSVPCNREGNCLFWLCLFMLHVSFL